MKMINLETALSLKNTIFIDVRTPSEYNEDHILNAVNMPLFKDEEHKEVGTIYKQQGKEFAIEKGFDFVGYKLKDFYKYANEIRQKYDNIVIYCARGGMRSGSICNLLSSIGIEVYKLEGGYKSYRNYVLKYLENIMETKKFIVVHGLTGCGKTDLLKMLQNNDIDNIDLEGIAKNKGSTFGFIGFDEKPPTQKRFETLIFQKIYNSKSNYIFIESESKRVGHVCVPNEIYDAIIRDGYHILLEDSVKNRVQRLYRDYILQKDEDAIKVLKDCINKFRKRLGNEKVDEYICLLDNKEYENLIQKYLVEYYDPLYMHSVQKYTYNKVVSFEDTQVGLKECIAFHRQTIEGEKVC